MPTIQQLPAATSVGNQDELPLYQDGQTVSVTVGTLLAGTQPAISIASQSLLGRNSIGPGGPEQVNVGLGLALATGTLASNGLDHASFAEQTALTLTDEAILNSSGTPMRMQLPLLRGLFSAGENVTIDQNGTITATGNGLQGPPGAPGTGITVGVGAPQGAATVSGNSYVDAATGNLYVAAGTDWSLVGTIVGPAGPTGPTGPAGPAGVAGPVGPAGPAGAQGPLGLMGPAGPAGPVGAVGPVGAQGPAGATGPAGPTGVQGPVGVSGTSLLSGSGAPAVGLGVNGDTFLNTATGDLYVRSGGAWTKSANITGPAGAPGTPGSSVTITGLPTITTLGAADLVGVSQGGTDHAISYANFLSGETIDEVQAATAAGDTDVVLVGQGSSSLLAQTFSGIWTWISGKLPGYRLPVAELTANTTLNVATHNARVLVCSLPLTLTANPAGMGSGFVCDVINASAGAIVLSYITSSTGVPSIAAGQSARIYAVTYSGGTLVYAALAVATGNPLPGQVTAVMIGTTTSQSVTLSWLEPASGLATGYIIQSRLTGTSSWSQLIVSGTSGTVTGLNASTSYDFTVISTNSAGLGPASALVQATTLATVAVLAAQVTALTVGAATQTTLALSWSAASGATGYVVQYRPSGSTTWTTFATNVTATNVTVTGLVAGTVYSFQVAAVSTGGTGPYSAIVQGQTTASAVATAPGQVTGLATGAATTASIAVSWTSTALATGYIVQYRTHGASTWSTFASGVTGTSDVVTGLTAGTAYDFQVAATNSAGTGAYSSVVTATTTSSALAVPGAITGLAVGTATNTTLPLSWTNPSSGGAIADITVQYRTPSGMGTWTTASSTVTATQTSYTISGLAAGTTYDVQVFATNASGAGTADVVPNVSTGSTSTIPNYKLTIFNNALPPNTSYSIAGGGTLNCFVNTNSEGGGSYVFPAAVWFFTTQNPSAIQSVGAMINGTGGTETPSSGYAYGWVAPCYVPMPATPGTWYVWAAAVDSNGVIGATLVGPVFTVTA